MIGNSAIGADINVCIYYIMMMCVLLYGSKKIMSSVCEDETSLCVPRNKEVKVEVH